MTVKDDALTKVHIVVESPLKVGGNSKLLLKLHKLKAKGKFSQAEEAVAEEHWVNIA
jgi:hypothetical protein